MKKSAKRTVSSVNPKSRAKAKAPKRLPRKAAAKAAKTGSRNPARKAGLSPRRNDLAEFAARRGVTLNPDQKTLFAELTEFFRDPRARCFLLKGSAGTGKTFLIKIIAEFIHYQLKRKSALAAPTGRAALVLRRVTGLKASTIHRLVYRLDGGVEKLTTKTTIGRTPIFYYPIDKLADDEAEKVFIIDEASMISDTYGSSEFYQWGSGRLLKDLIDHTRLRDPEFQTKIIFVGDPCQLPPPGDELSCALDEQYLMQGLFITKGELSNKPNHEEAYGLKTKTYELNAVVRQKSGDILKTATDLRKLISDGTSSYFRLTTSRGDIVPTTIADMCEKTAAAFRKNPLDGIIVTYSNRDAFDLNASVREILWGYNQPTQKGDRLLVYQNGAGLINGELIIVHKVFPIDEHVVKEPTGDGGKVVTASFRKIQYIKDVDLVLKRPPIHTTYILEEFLHSPKRDISPGVFRAIYEDFRKRFKQGNPKVSLAHNFMPDGFVSEFRNDPYVNCAKVKYGYAMTCQKAQGGQWDCACVQNYLGITNQSKLFLRWAYTAITRARTTLYCHGLTPFNPITSLAPSYLPSPSAYEESTLSLTQRFLQDFFDKALNSLGIHMAGLTIKSNDTTKTSVYKLQARRGTEECVIDFYGDKKGAITSYNVSKGPKQLATMIRETIDIYRSIK